MSKGNLRRQQKDASKARIVEAASICLREQGAQNTGIAQVMAKAGLTHGAFYAHFQNKEDLTRAAFRYALDTTQPDWFSNNTSNWSGRLSELAEKYLSPLHRDNRNEGCAIAALLGEIPTSGGALKSDYEHALANTLEKVAGEGATPAQHQAAVAFLSLCVGGIQLARSVQDPQLSDQILEACLHHAATIAVSAESNTSC